MMFALFGGVHHGTAQSFVLASSPGVGASPSSVTAADVNGDGRVDLISANQGDSTLSVLTNGGGGNFGLNATINVGNNIATISVTSADVNRDHKPDLICANFGNNTLSVFTNDGNGNFVLASTNKVGGGPSSVVAADVKGDGKVDLICANANDNTLSILTNTGNSTFGSNATLHVGSSPFASPVSVAAADVNGDGKVDLICANSGDNTLSVLTNKGNGTFAAAVDYSVGNAPQSVTTADVNGDGKVDLICANANDNTLSILTNTGNGTFVLASSPGVGGIPYSVTAADVNHDGKTDLICANASDNTLSVLTNDGSGNFGSFATPSVGDIDIIGQIFPQSVTTADVNNDGTVDLVCANQGNSTLSVFFNGPTLAIKQSGNSVTVSWLDIWTGWTNLQQNSNLTTTNWISTGGVTDDGTNQSLTIIPSSGKLFFRLSNP